MDVGDVVAVGTGKRGCVLSPDGAFREKISRGHESVMAHIRDGTVVYGVTPATGTPA